MSRPRTCVLASCLLIATSVAAFAQSTARLIVDQWRVEDGLPQNTITSLAQDERGYLWIATRKGLARFDGAQFTPVTRVGTMDLGNLRLTAVLPDGDGVLWVSTYGSGVLRVAGGVVTRYGEAEGVPDDIVWDLYRDRQRRVWLASSSGARVFDGRRWQAPPLPADLAGDGVNAVFQARSGTMWFATSHHGAVSVDGTVVGRYSIEAGLPSPIATSVAETPDGAIWVTGARGVSRIDNGVVTTFGPDDGLPVERVLQVLVDRRGVVWMATHGGGLVRYDGAQFTAFRRSDGLSSDYLISLAEDRDGALWVGTLAGGLNRLAPAARELLDVRSGLPPFPVTTVSQVATTLDWWIGTYGGGLVSLRGGKLRTLTTRDGLPSNAITSVACDLDGSVWVGTNGGGAFRLQEGHVVEHLGPEVVGATLRTIEVSNEAVWFGGNGVVRYQKGVIRRFGKSDGLRSNEVRAIYALADRTWVGTYSGGLQSIERNGRIVSWGEREGLTNPFVTSLQHDRTGTLWIGTYGGGLFRLQHGKMSSITTRDGLPDDVVFDVLEDDAGRLWLTGTQGLAVVRIADVHARMDGRGGVLSVAQYGRAEGVPGTDGTDGNQPLSWLAKDGRLWFATVDGVVIFDPTEVADTPAAPAVSIDTVQVNKARVELSALVSPLPARSIDIAYSAPRLMGGAAPSSTSTASSAWTTHGSMPGRPAPRRSRTCHRVVTTSRSARGPIEERHQGRRARSASRCRPASTRPDGSWGSPSRR